MHISRPVGLLCAAACLAAAKGPEAAPPAKPGPSAYVRCDGSPNNITAGETAARVIAITALVGLLIPQHEAADMSKRLTGAEGVAACDEAIGRESNPTRRVQLILARSIHHIEAGDHAAALADARLAETDQPALAATLGFRLSFHLSALELEGLALAAAGKGDEAAAKGIEMGAAAPYDLVNMLRAARLVALGGTYGPEQARFYDAFVRLYPEGLGQRALARQMGGDFRGTAEDMETWTELVQSVTDKPVANGTLAYAYAQAAINRALAGDLERAQAHVARARELQQAVIAAGKSNDAADTAELLDFYHIDELARAGKAAEARILFGARSAWTRPYPGSVSEMARLLRAGAKPEELTGLLAADPASFRTEWLAGRARQLNEGGTDGKARYAAIRTLISQGQLNAFSGNVWKSGKSKYFASNEDARMKARLINVLRNGDGIPSGYALMLHSALVAKAEGKSAFMLLPLRKYIYSTYVRTGNPGEGGVIAPISYDAERVIADLGAYIPPPAPSH